MHKRTVTTANVFSFAPSFSVIEKVMSKMMTLSLALTPLKVTILIQEF